MPHVVFDKKIDLSDYSKKFFPIFQKKPLLIRISTIFIDKENLTALLPTVVISDIHQQYLIEISTTQSKTTIRLCPLTDPVKTYGVKLSIALLANNIMKTYSDFQIQKSNLSKYLSVIANDPIYN